MTANPAGAYPQQRACNERRQLWFGFWCTFIDFGNAADITPRYHVIADVGGDIGDMPFGGDDFKELVNDAARVLFVVRKGIDEQ